MKKKRLIIIVPGHKSLDKYPKPIQKIVLFFANLSNIMPAYDIGMFDSYEKIIRSYGDTKVLRWNRTADFPSEKMAKKNLQKMVSRYKEREITIIGLSLGGLIVLDSLEKKLPQIMRVILIGSINSISKVPNYFPETINIYSAKDNLQKFAIESLTLSKGKKKLSGRNVQNIVIKKMTHRDLCKNKKIKKGVYKDQTIMELVGKFL